MQVSTRGTGELVEIPVGGADGPMRGYLARPRSPGKHPPVVVAHELFGVTADIRGVVDELAGLGFLAVAPEFYHRHAPAGLELPRDDEGRRRGFEFLNRLTREGVVADVEATRRYLAGREDCTGRVGMLGFSMGGHIAYLAATQVDLAATAVVYGGWIASRDIPLSRPEPTLALTPGIALHHGRLLYIVGGRDKLIDAAQVRAVERALTEARVPHEVLVYPDAEHAFFWEGTPAFHRASHDDAWTRIRAFFGNALVLGRGEEGSGS